MRRVITNHLRRFFRETEGATLTELAMLIPLLLVFVFGAIEFGRFGYNEVLAQKATDIAARTAAVRPPICADVPPTHVPASGSPRIGTLCRSGNGICDDPGEKFCTLAAAADTATANEVWNRISALLPAGATRSNVRIRYTFNDDLGFIGGPYTPIVTAEIISLEFIPILPLNELLELAGTLADGPFPDAIVFPSMSASLPAEDLGQGIGG